MLTFGASEGVEAKGALGRSGGLRLLVLKVGRVVVLDVLEVLEIEGEEWGLGRITGEEGALRCPRTLSITLLAFANSCFNSSPYNQSFF
jgi:hypothetical protein